MQSELTHLDYYGELLKEFGFTSEVFIQRFLFILLINDGRTVDEIEAFLNSFRTLTAVSRKTLDIWRKKYENKELDIRDGRAGRVQGFAPHNKNIVQAYKKGGYTSAKEMSKQTGLSLTTICRHLNNNGMRYVHFKKVPYLLSQENRNQRVKDARSMLEILKNEEKHNFCNILTMDETPVYLDNHRKLGWVNTSDKIPNIVKESLRRKKFTLTVMWGVGVFPVVEGLTGENRVNSKYFCTNILTKAKIWCEKKRKSSGVSSYIFHMDNAPCHRSSYTTNFMRDNNIVRMDHPPYSPDLAPSDFFLFGYMKDHFADTTFKDMDDAVLQISTWLRSIDKKVIIRTFKDWMERLQECIDNEGEYVRIRGEAPTDVNKNKETSPKKKIIQPKVKSKK